MVEVFELFSRPILREMEKHGIETPTEIQRLAIPKILSGENTLLIAPTGLGKTEAAVLPLFEMFLRLRSRGEEPSGISMLYVTPLRSLNRDILRRLVEVGAELGIRIEVRHGDTPTAVRKMQAESPPNMLITTPETLQAILVGRKMRRHLKGVRWVVVDEIHELAEDKRGAQLSLALQRLSALVGGDFQRIGLSATIGEAETVGGFLVGRGRSVRIIKAGVLRDMDVGVESPSPTREDAETAGKVMVPVGTVSRVRRILELASKHRTTLVFTNTREHAESLASKIRMVAPQLPLGIHHGSLSKGVRIETEQQMKNGNLRVVVCTSSLELGIDIGVIDFVVQFQSPKQVTKAVQRIGRSGHAVLGKPRGCVIAAWPDDILESAVILRKALTGELEKPSIQHGALDALAHQVAGLTLDFGSVTLEEAYSTVSRAYPYCNLTLEGFVETVNQLHEERKIRFYDGKIRVNSPSTYEYYFENLSMIPDVKQYVVVDYASRKKIGVLDQEFVARRGKPDNQFILHGSVWQVLMVDEDRRVVEVEGVEPSPAAIPAWEGEVIPVPFEVACEVGKLRRAMGSKITEIGDPVEALEGYPLDESSRSKVVSGIRKHMDGGFPLPHDRCVVIDVFENYVIIHACLGDKANQTLSRILASLLTSRIGLDVAVQSDPYRVALITPYPVDPYLIERMLTGLKPEDVPRIVEAVIDQTTLFVWRFWNNAKRFGVITKKAEYKLSQAQALLRALKGNPIYKETLREVCVENLDMDVVEKLVEKIRAGEVEVQVASPKLEPSPLSMPLLDKVAPHDLLRPVKERGEVVALLRERLNSKDVRLTCVFKGDWEAVRRVGSLPEKIRCPSCRSTLVAVTHRDDGETRKVVRRKLSRKKLSSEEEKAWLNAWKNASLVQGYGKRAVIAMAARGVGPSTAARILRKPRKTEDKFYAEILRAEREYLRTRMFWD